MNLDPLSTEAGCYQHLILAECRGPATPGYSFSEIQTVMKAMRACIQNRLALSRPRLFCSVGATTSIHYMFAPVSGVGCQAQQFRGFSWNAATSTPVIAAPQQTVIDNLLAVANNASDPRQQRFITHINEAKAVSSAAVTDPFSGIPNIIGTESIRTGVYGWRTGGAGGGGGAYRAIPQTVVPYSHPNGYIQGIQFYTILADASLLLLIEKELDENAADLIN
jgi:hypothetical protein